MPTEPEHPSVMQLGSPPPAYKVWMINLDRDAGRLARVTEWYRDVGVPFERYPAVLGSSVGHAERFLSLRFGRDTEDGTLGCALSHIGLWTKIAAGEDDYALVLEDDAKPIAPFPRDMSELGCPRDFDVLYVNARMVPRGLSPDANEPRALRLADAMALRAPGQRGHGTDGYFISKKGAARMLRFAHQDRVLGHIDLQMIACGISEEQFASLVALNERFAGLQRVRRRRSSHDTCQMYVSTLPLVTQWDEGVSARTQKVKGGHALDDEGGE